MPIYWVEDYAPFTIIGDVKWLDVNVTVDVSVDLPGACALSLVLCVCVVCVSLVAVEFASPARVCQPHSPVVGGVRSQLRSSPVSVAQQ